MFIEGKPPRLRKGLTGVPVVKKCLKFSYSRITRKQNNTSAGLILHLHSFILSAKGKQPFRAYEFTLKQKSELTCIKSEVRAVMANVWAP